MHFFLLTFPFVYVARAIQVAFLEPPVAAQNVTFAWTRAGSDRDNFYLAQKKVDNSSGPAITLDKVHVQSNGSQNGTGTIYFSSVGLYQVDLFDEEDKNSQQSLLSMTITVILNPNSTEPLIAQSVIAGTNIRNLAPGAIVGIALGALVLAAGIAVGIFVLHQLNKRDRHRQQIISTEAIIFPFPSETPFTGEKKRLPHDEESASTPTVPMEHRDSPPPTTRHPRGARRERPRRERRFIYHNDSGWRSLAGGLKLETAPV